MLQCNLLLLVVLHLVGSEGALRMLCCCGFCQVYICAYCDTDLSIKLDVSSDVSRPFARDALPGSTMRILISQLGGTGEQCHQTVIKLFALCFIAMCFVQIGRIELLSSSSSRSLLLDQLISRQAGMSTSDPNKLARRLSKVKHILLVLSGKGGVGKSSISVQLALSLLNQGQTGAPEGEEQNKPVRIGLLDIDLTGPSIPRMLGLDGASIHQSDDGWVPVYLPIQHLQASSSPSPLSNQQQDDDRQQEASQPEASTSALPAGTASASESFTNGNQTNVPHELKVMSIGFLLKDSRQAVVWRGPKKSAMIRQFLADVRWGELDWLIIDTPPGESSRCASFAILAQPS